MKIVAVLMMSLAIIACGAKKNASKNGAVSQNGEKITALVGEFAKMSDPIVSIDTAYIVENTLFVDLSYSGGCEKHEFNAIGSLAIAKSYPPIRSIQIVHNANGDSCREIKKTSLEIDVKNLAYQQEEGSEIYYTIEGWNGRIYHKYVK